MIIQLEGCEAAGKSFLLKYLSYYLEELNISVEIEHFPSTKTDFGKLAHSLLYSDRNPNIDTNFLITLAAIGDQHIYKPYMTSYLGNKNNAYLTSRGLISTLVYSDLFNHDSSNLTAKLLPLLEYLPHPDAIIYLNPSLEEVTCRLSGRAEIKSIYDQQELASIIKAKYDSVLDCLDHRYSILHIEDDNLFSSIDIHLHNIYKFVYCT